MGCFSIKQPLQNIRLAFFVIDTLRQFFKLKVRSHLALHFITLLI